MKVFNTVVERIVEGSYVPGSMLPSEFDLAHELAVSQGTARKAFIELEQKGIVQRRQGKGTFVTLRTPENSLFHFFRLRDRDGAQVAPELKNESIVLRNALKDEKAALFSSPEKVYEINRVRSFNGTPLCHERSVVPANLFPGLKDRGALPNALYVLFQHAYSCIIISAQEHLAAEVLSEKLAAALEKETGTPVIVARRQARDLLDRVVELRTSHYLTQSTSYFVDLK
jgi:GntR family transcriptional regulator